MRVQFGQLTAPHTEIAGSAPISRIVLGGRFGEFDDRLAFRLLDTYRDLGGTTLDTANSYGDGAHQQVLGRWERERRARMTVIAKGCHVTPATTVTPADVRSEVRRALGALGQDVLDVFMLHRHPAGADMAELRGTLDGEVAAGTVRSYAVSNWAPDEIAALESAGPPIPPLLSSCQLSLARPREPMWPGARSLADADRAAYAAAGRTLLSWSPLARGWLIDTGDPGQHRPDRARSDAVYDTPANRERRARAAGLARELGVPLAAVCLAYVLDQPFPVAAVVGPECEDELVVAAQACELALSDEDRRHLEEPS